MQRQNRRQYKANVPPGRVRAGSLMRVSGHNSGGSRRVEVKSERGLSLWKVKRYLRRSVTKRHLRDCASMSCL